MEIKSVMRKYFHKYTSRTHNIRYKYAELYDEAPIQEKTVLYESRDGNSFVDSPYRIFQELVTNTEFKDFRHTIVINENNIAAKAIIEKIVELIPNKVTNQISYVIRNSDDYLECLASYKYLINNSTFQNFFIKKDEQIYINTWHGTPLKYMGFDIPGNPSQSQNVLRNYLMTDYLLSPNAHTSRIFTNGYKLEGIYQGQLMESGYPRIDNTYHPLTNMDEKLSYFGITLDGRPTILYCPTWSGSSITSPANNIKQLIAEFDYLQQELGKDYQLFVKVHPYLYPFVKDLEELAGVLISDFFDVNELLSVVDILVTDYSSIFFDFLVEEKPIFFYCPDYEQYIGDRGVYLPLDSLPGPLSTTIMVLCEQLKDYTKKQENGYEAVVSSYRQTFCQYDDGQVAKRLINQIFLGVDEDLKVVPTENGKERLVFYPGSMENNGITSSFINLMHNLDYEKYDVSLLLRTTKNYEDVILTNLARLPEQVRLLFRPGNPLLRFYEDLADDKFRSNPENLQRLKELPIEGYKRESKRALGNTSFKAAIDFSGYSFYWGIYTAFADAKTKIVYQHNDLFSDSNKVIEGRKVHYLNLNALFRLYNQFDYILSVSKATMLVNRESLVQFVNNPDKFQYCINTIDPTRILTLAGKLVADDSIEELTTPTVDFKLHKEAGVGNVIESRVPVYQDLSCIEKKQETIYSFIPGERIETAARAEVAGRCYVKTLKEHILIGWIEEQFIVPGLDPVLEKTPHESLYRMIYPGNHLIWKEPKDTVKENVEVTDARSTRGIYFHSKWLVRTMRSAYVDVWVRGKLLGWVDIAAAKDVYSHATTAVRSYYKVMSYKVNHSLSFKIKENTLMRFTEDFYGRVSLNEGDIVWARPIGLFDNRPQIVDLKQLNKSVLHVVTKAITAKGASYQAEKDGRTIGWISDDKVTQIDASKDVLLATTDIDVVLKLKENNVLYQSITLENPVNTSIDYHTGYPSTQMYETIEGSIYRIDLGTNRYAYAPESAVTIIKNNMLTDINGDTILPINPAYQNFVNIGRLSPEKNQANLILAFKTFVQEQPDARLYIMGDGVLKDELLDLIMTSGLQEKVFLLGQKLNPFEILVQCDYFILPSLYEGQPMVLLEAMTLGMTIIASDIPANRDVLKDGTRGILIEGTTSEAIADTLLAGNYRNRHFDTFDAYEYNRQAVASFYRFIE